ncbi:Protein msta, isoform B [Papilio xuthus]|uniref:Protein msta, isoform B n=1 Tax=Papilio xuthus TaxID=66420 RepID=A0A194PMK5_PAPXU|nr:Protein msta, isoform B [Papilio xuthus]
MEVYASKNIEFGEEIFTCYTNFLWCTPVRRYQLYKSKNFWCKCVRCKDPYEMGTNLSAIKCFNKQCTGLILPENPINPSSEWFCDSCTSKIPFEKINSVQNIIGSLVSVLSEDDDINPNGIVLQRLESFLPSCSHIFVDLHLRWTLKLGYFEGMSLYELSEYRLALKEQLCRDTLRTAAALGAGDAHLRGLLLYHLHAALAERARRCPDLYDDLKSEIETTIDQANKILQGDISAPPDLELRHRYLGPGCDKPQEERFFILDTSEKLAVSKK